MSALTLYDFPLSGNCYKVRLLLAMLGLSYQRIRIDSTTLTATQTPEFRRINPRGQIPVLVDGDITIWDSMAILVYLARREQRSDWLPNDALGEARVMQWLAISENELLYGLARARATIRFGRPFNLEQCQQEAHAGLNTLNLQLEQSPWLCGETPTIADLACYPYVHLAPEAEVSLDAYPAVREWVTRLEALPDWVPIDA
jgi:glutathione S-transferase